jgi:hypothetical protein
MDHSDVPLVCAQEVENKPFITFYYESTFTVTMAPKCQAVDILKKGLNNFSKKIKAQKDTLTLKLSCRENISLADERWLDYEANTADEECVLHDLKKASDYERAFERLDKDRKAIVKRLKELEGELMKVAGSKRKHM